MKGTRWLTDGDIEKRSHVWAWTVKIILSSYERWKISFNTSLFGDCIPTFTDLSSITSTINLNILYMIAFAFHCLNSLEANTATRDSGIIMATKWKIRFQTSNCSSEWNETPPIPSWRLVAVEHHLNDRYQCHWRKQSNLKCLTRVYGVRVLQTRKQNIENAVCNDRIIQGIKLHCEPKAIPRGDEWIIIHTEQ